MYNVSDDYKLAATSNARVHRLSGTVGGVSFDGGDVIRNSFVVKNQLCQATAISLGGVYIGELDITFSNEFAAAMNIRGSWRGTAITASIGVELEEESGEDETFEDIPLGIYTVDEAIWTDDGLKIVAYDNMSRFDRPFAIDQSSGYVYDFLSLFCQECGVTIGMTKAECEALPNGTEILGMYDNAEIETFRDALSQLATVCCCFATINRSGQLVLRRLPDATDIIDEIPAKMRYSTSFCDFASYYDTITVVNVVDESVSAYSNQNIGGLTMNLGSNPFLQFGTDSTKTRIRQAIVNALQGFRATPFTVSILPNPAYDLGDLIKFSGGYGLNSLGCVMSLSMRVNSTTLEGYGENPALADARSKTDKEISGLIAKTSENEVVIHAFENATEHELEEDELEKIVEIRFATVNPKIVNIWHEIELDVESDPLGDGVVSCQAFYYLNDELITYSPITTWDNDGKHLLHLLYFLNSLPENAAQKWEVKLKMTGGTATIGRGDIHASLYGQGLVAVASWDGFLEVTDEFTPLDQYGQQIISFSDEADAELFDYDDISASDTFELTQYGQQQITFSDDADAVLLTPTYSLITEDGQNNVTTEDGDPIITEGDY